MSSDVIHYRVLWLAVFVSDRKSVPTHLPLAWTYSSAEEIHSFITQLETLARAVQSQHDLKGHTDTSVPQFVWLMLWNVLVTQKVKLSLIERTLHLCFKCCTVVVFPMTWNNFLIQFLLTKYRIAAYQLATCFRLTFRKLKTPLKVLVELFDKKT